MTHIHGSVSTLILWTKNKNAYIEIYRKKLIKGHHGDELTHRMKKALDDIESSLAYKLLLLSSYARKVITKHLFIYLFIIIIYEKRFLSQYQLHLVKHG